MVLLTGSVNRGLERFSGVIPWERAPISRLSEIGK